MSRISLGLALLAIPAISLADVTTIECTGTSPAGTQQTFKVNFDEVAGWVDDNGTIKYRDGVTPYFLTGIKVQIDRESGTYATRKTTAGEKFTGTCKAIGGTKVVAAANVPHRNF